MPVHYHRRKIQHCVCWTTTHTHTNWEREENKYLPLLGKKLSPTSTHDVDNRLKDVPSRLRNDGELLLFVTKPTNNHHAVFLLDDFKWLYRVYFFQNTQHISSFTFSGHFFFCFLGSSLLRLLIVLLCLADFCFSCSCSVPLFSHSTPTQLLVLFVCFIMSIIWDLHKVLSQFPLFYTFRL